MRLIVFAAACAAALASSAVPAGQSCNGRPVPSSARTCPDGSIPMFTAEEVRPAATPRAAETTRPEPGERRHDARHGGSGPEALFGVWRTRIPGAVWTSPSGYAGYDWLHATAGVSVGDLVIKPDGTYVWNSYGGKSGKWVRGDADYPVVLIDTVENRRWKVGVDPKRTGGRDIVVWDGRHYGYDGRR